MCHSVHWEGGQVSLSRGISGSVQGVVSVQGDLCLGVSVQGHVSVRAATVRETPIQRPSPVAVTSGRYTSYWNAFLLY